MQDAERVVHPGKKSAPLIVPTKAWEGNSTYIYGSVLDDQPPGSGYRMWYTAYANRTYYLCYATSEDGVTWEKPDLEIIEFQGSSRNNICRVGGGTLIYDPCRIWGRAGAAGNRLLPGPHHMEPPGQGPGHSSGDPGRLGRWGHLYGQWFSHHR